MTRNGRRKGEWLEWTADQEIHVIEELEPILPVQSPYLRKLERTGGLSFKGKRVRLRLFPEEPLQYMPEWSEIDVLYEDDFCLVVDKPAGMKVHPTKEGETGTLLQAVGWHVQAAGEACRPRHIHRLDEDTTGPVLFAKYDWAQLQLDAAMREKRIDRRYVAIVQGELRQAKGRIDAPIGRDRHHATRRRVSTTGDPAVTHYELVERLQGASLVRLKLETGRTHQIRVHLSHLGHPLIGDTLYGGRKQGLERQALHGEKLSFPHPWTGQPMETEAPWPADFDALYRFLKK
jgi:23S rRNA pseudouridine1911/1915/1917 synthase